MIKKLLFTANALLIVYLVYASTAKPARLKKKVKELQQMNTKLSSENQLLRYHNIAIKRKLHHMQQQLSHR